MNCTDHNCTAVPLVQVPLAQIVARTGVSATGVISALLNVITTTVLSRSKNLNSPCFAIVTGCSIGSAIAAVSMAANSVVELGEWSGQWSQANFTRATCLTVNMYVCGFASVRFCGMAVTLLAVDRLFGTLAPIRYRDCGKRTAVIGLTVCASLSALEATIMIISAGPFDELVPYCTVIPSLSIISILATINIGMVLGILCVLCYMAMFLSAYVQRRKVMAKVHGGFKSANELQQFRKQQNLIMPAAKMLAILYFVLSVVPDLCVNFFRFEGTMSYVVGQMRTSSTLVEFISLFIRCKTFRKEVMSLFR